MAVVCTYLQRFNAKTPVLSKIFLLFIVILLTNNCCCERTQLKENLRNEKVSFSLIQKLIKVNYTNEKKRKESKLLTNEVDRDENQDKFKSIFQLEKDIERPAYKIRNDLNRFRRSIRSHAGKSETNSRHYCTYKIQSITGEFSYECRPVAYWQNGEIGSNRINGSWHSRSLNFSGHVLEISNASEQWFVPENVNILTLHQQNIGKIKANSFYFLRNTLRRLRLDSNVITAVSRSAFAGLENLVELDLSRNKLRSFPHNAFTNLVNLKTLLLANNQIDYVGENFLAGLNFLSFLDLSENAIVDVHENAFYPVNLSRSLVVNLRRNRLVQSRRGWLVQPRSKESFSFSDTSNINDQSMDEESKDLEKMYRIFWGEENPWICKRSYSVVFLQTLIQIRFPSFKDFLSNDIDEDLTMFLLNDKNLNKMGVDITLPCSDLSVNGTPADLGSPFESAMILNKTTCTEYRIQSGSPLDRVSCQILSIWLKKYGSNTNEEEYGITNSQVTVIGILIVVLCPILLTLCPDCNKKTRTSEERKIKEKLATSGFFDGRSSFLSIRSCSKRSKT